MLTTTAAAQPAQVPHGERADNDGAAREVTGSSRRCFRQISLDSAEQRHGPCATMQPLLLRLFRVYLPRRGSVACLKTDVFVQ